MTDRIWEILSDLAGQLTGEEVMPDELMRLANSTNTAKEEHSALCAARYAAGWRYDVVEDEHAKTSPLLRPWADLTDQQRADIKTVRACAKTAARILDAWSFAEKHREALAKGEERTA